MAARPQNSPRGLFAKNAIQTDSGMTFTSPLSALPTSSTENAFRFIKNSTGVRALAINTTGTTWKYFNLTSVIPS